MAARVVVTVAAVCAIATASSGAYGNDGLSASAAPVSRFVLAAAGASGLPLNEVSGLAWDADQQLLYAVSDQGKVYALRVKRDGDTLASIEVVSAAALADPQAGEDRAKPPRRFNAEGLAVQRGSDGQPGNSELVVALEGNPPQIARFSPAGRLLGSLAVPPPADDRANYRKKSHGLESVALHPAFGVITAPESPLRNRPTDLHTVYANGHAWSFARQAPDSRLKGLEVLQDGSLLVLERSRPGTSRDLQVASLRRVDIAHCNAQAACPATLVALLPAGPENFEGLTLLDARHALIASDDGGVPGQDTVFALITLP